MNAEGKTVEAQLPLVAASSPPTGKLSDPVRCVEEYGEYLFKVTTVFNLREVNLLQGDLVRWPRNR